MRPTQLENSASARAKLSTSSPAVFQTETVPKGREWHSVNFGPLDFSGPSMSCCRHGKQKQTETRDQETREEKSEDDREDVNQAAERIFREATED
jgi:hypothetical protein